MFTTESHRTIVSVVFSWKEKFKKNDNILTIRSPWCDMVIAINLRYDKYR